MRRFALPSPKDTVAMLALDGDYVRDGFVVARGLIDRQTLYEMRCHVAALMACQPEAEERNLVSGIVLDDTTWLRFVGDERLLDLAEHLLGTDLALFSSNYVIKPPGRGKHVAWHQDGASWPLDPVSVVSLWVAIDDADDGNGGLRMIPASHAGPFRAHRNDPDRLSGSVFSVATEPTSDEIRRARSVDLRAGDVSAHHPAVLHGSGPNRSSRPRTALVIRYTPTSVRVTVDPWPSRVVLRQN